MNARRCLQVLALGLALAHAGAHARRTSDPDAWRKTFGPSDRERLRGWRATWMRALAQARDGGFGRAIDAEGALLQPDAGIGSEMPPDGPYRCRTVKLGSQTNGGNAFVANPWLACRIDGMRFTKLTGSQRPAGDLRRDESGRLLFIGAMALGDEAAALPHGRDPERDMVGIVERIGPGRWRLVIPQPRWESLLDVIELVPGK